MHNLVKKTTKEIGEVILVLNVQCAHTLLTSCAAQTNLHSRVQAAFIVEKVRQVVVDIWHLERFPICELLQ